MSEKLATTESPKNVTVPKPQVLVPVPYVPITQAQYGLGVTTNFSLFGNNIKSILISYEKEKSEIIGNSELELQNAIDTFASKLADEIKNFILSQKIIVNTSLLTGVTAGSPAAQVITPGTVTPPPSSLPGNVVAPGSVSIS